MFSSVLTKKNMLLLFYYTLVVMMITNIRRGRIFGVTIWMDRITIPLLIVILLYDLFIAKNDPHSLKLIVITSLVMIFISCIINIRGLLLNPYAARMVGGDTALEIARTGISGYGFHSGLPPLIPPLVLWAKKTDNKLQKSFLYGFATIVMITVFLGAFTAPLLLAIAGFALSMVGQNIFHKGYSIIVVLVIVLLLIVVPPNVLISKALLGLANIAPTEEVRVRVTDIETAISSGVEIDAETRVETTAEGRIKRYYYNYEVFMRNPLFGNRESISGDGHLFWAYQLALFGIVGFSALIWVLVNIIKTLLAHLRGEYRFFYWLSLGLLIVMGLMKVILGDFMFFIPLFLSPAILLYLQNQENSNNNSSAGSTPNQKEQLR